MRRFAAVVFILMSLVAPFASAVVPDDTRQAGPIGTSPDLNMTGTDIANHSIPSRYGISPTPIELKVQISDTSLPGPKGEMAAGPRTIGVTADPVSLAILVVVIITGAAGVWYLVKRKPETSDDKDEENSE